MTRNKKNIIISGIILIIGIAVFIFLFQFSSPQTGIKEERFIISLTMPKEEIIPKLKGQGYIKNEWAFNFVLKIKGWHGEIELGGYKISKSMTAWKIAKILTSEPYMKWVVIPEGLRKEQIAEILATKLGWSEQERSDWVTKFTAMKYDYLEGVYFPDTYLIPKDESGLEIAQRFINKFNEEFAPYSEKFIKANIKWDTALKIASLIQREAAGKDDMFLIAGIIWNRLLKGMKLEIDATLQYTRDSKLAFDDLCNSSGNREQWQCECENEPDNCYMRNGFYKGIDNWWTPITVVDKQIDSEYNTYLYKGLPPHPICNSGLDAIDAVLNSAETECLYYLHDSNRQIHCAKTYKEHKANIEKYLK